MYIASVIVDVMTQALDTAYSYAVPDDLFAPDRDLVPQVGCAVLVSLGGRSAVGYIVGMEEVHALPGEECDLWGNPVSTSKLKAIEQVLTKPYFDEEGAACALWLADRYVAPLASCVHLLTPPGAVPRVVRDRSGRWKLMQPSIGQIDDRWVVRGPSFESFIPRKNASKQQAIMEALSQGDVRVAELTAVLGAVGSTLKSLEDKGAICLESRRRMRGLDDGPTAASSDMTLTPGQLEALEEIECARAARNGSAVLIDGVTGSGKTEVYLQAISRTLAEGKNAIMLVPEISLTPQTVARFRGRFGNAVAVMHSRMSDGERYDQWDFIKSGQAKVVVGARSALFTPLSNVGLIVIDEEHESSYKQDSAPRYSAREVALWMMQRAGGAVVLGSATPSIESLYAVAKDPLWSRVALPERANGRPLPAIEVIDMAAEFRGGSRAMFSGKLTHALVKELEAGHKVVLMLNQRGFAKFLLCRDCGFVPECPSCSTSLTYHERGGKLMCHHCGYTVAAPPTCPSCASPYLKKFGAGTQRVEDELRMLLNSQVADGQEIPIIRMDADTTRTKGAHQELLEKFAHADAAVLLGTQMIAKGLDFQDVTLVGVINADTQLHLPDYRAGERTFQLIEQVAGRAGRAELPGQVLVQTYEKGDPAIRAAAHYDRGLFLRAELPKRKVLEYPPYVHMANILIWGKNEHQVEEEAHALYQQLEKLLYEVTGATWKALAPTPCVLSKLRNTYRWHIVVKCPLDQDIAGPLVRLFRERKPHSEVRVAVDIDPVSLL